MTNPKSVRLLTDRPLKSFGQGHLEFVTDKKGQTRTGRLGVFEGDSANIGRNNLSKGIVKEQRGGNN